MRKLRLSSFKLALWIVKLNGQVTNGNLSRGISCVKQNSKDLRNIFFSSANGFLISTTLIIHKVRSLSQEFNQLLTEGWKVFIPQICHLGSLAYKYSLWAEPRMPCSYLTVILSFACNMQCTPSTFFWNRTKIGGEVPFWWSCFILQVHSDTTGQLGFSGLRQRNLSEIMWTFVT